MKHHGITCPCFVYVPACSAQFTDVDFEAALSNSLKQFLHISGLKHEQKLCLETVAQKRDVFGILPTGFGKSLSFPIAAAFTERLMETRTCLCIN